MHKLGTFQEGVARVFAALTTNQKICSLHEKCVSFHLTLSYGPQHQDTRLLDHPVKVKEQAFQERQEVG